MPQNDLQPYDVNELKKHINKPVKLSTIDGKLFEGVLGHVDEQNIYIVIPIIIGSNQVGDIGGHHVGDIDGRSYYPYAAYGSSAGWGYSSYYTRSYNGQLILPLAVLSDISLVEGI